jgi:gamma-glutamyl-gamma-aminobutyrate hydrolase PuuD
MPRVGITYRYKEKLAPYVTAILETGLEPVPLLPPADSLDGLHGLVISGGTDINPTLYRQIPHEENDNPDDERDTMELHFIRKALAMDLPLLCICRGMQLLNVAQGGDLLQHLPQTDLHKQIGVTDAHAIIIQPGTKLAAITGEGPHFVNSRHHQAIQKLGNRLMVSAVSADQIIEGIELPDRRFALAVQWHPEDRMKTRAVDQRLFQAFAGAVSRP